MADSLIQRLNAAYIRDPHPDAVARAAACRWKQGKDLTEEWVEANQRIPMVIGAHRRSWGSKEWQIVTGTYGDWTFEAWGSPARVVRGLGPGRHLDDLSEDYFFIPVTDYREGDIPPCPQ